MAALLLDTDVLVDYLRGKTEAVAYLENLAEPCLVSTITVAELYAGVREGEEREALDGFLSAFQVIPLTLEISVQGGLFRRDFGKSHNVGLADALIAATAVAQEATMVTLNKKHFPMLPNVTVPYQKP